MFTGIEETWDTGGGAAAGASNVTVRGGGSFSRGRKYENGTPVLASARINFKGGGVFS